MDCHDNGFTLTHNKVPQSHDGLLLLDALALNARRTVSGDYSPLRPKGGSRTATIVKRMEAQTNLWLFAGVV